VRVYPDAPRGKYEEVLRSIGSVLDRHNLRDILLVEVDEGFIVRGVALAEAAAHGEWGSLERTELRFGDGEVQGDMDAAFARRGSAHDRGPAERALRIIGRYVDGIKGSDIMAAEQGEDWLLRCLQPGTLQHVLVEFLAPDVAQLNDAGERQRR
jgi:hypothetical protein